MKAVTYGIIGAGNIAALHARALSSLENAELAAVYDRNPAAAKRLADEYGCKCTSDFRAFLADPEAAVGIVSNNFHLYRACALARRLGYQKVFPLPAGCHPVLFPNYMVRECFAVWKSWGRLILSKI